MTPRTTMTAIRMPTNFGTSRFRAVSGGGAIVLLGQFPLNDAGRVEVPDCPTGTAVPAGEFKGTCISVRSHVMDWDRVEGNWKQIKGKVKEQWGKLTDDVLNVIDGKRDQLEGKLQGRCGWEKDRARSDVDNWYSSQRW